MAADLSASPASSSSSLQSPPLFSAIAPLDSPPDSPATPWRPGSTAYPPTNTPVRDHVPHPSPLQSPSPYLRNSKLELQELCDSLSEAAYDLSLRDIVEPPHSLHRHVSPAASSFPETTIMPAISTTISKTLKEELRRSSDVDVSASLLHQSKTEVDISISMSSPTPKCRLSLRFGLSAPCRKSGSRKPEEKKATALPSLAMDEEKLVLLRMSKRRSRRSVGRATPSPSPSPSPARRSSTTTRRRSTKQMHEIYQQNSPSRRSIACARSGIGQTRTKSRSRDSSCSPAASHNHPSRVHPSTQCSSCASYTVFFKSRCSACGKLYCSNCAKDAMHAALDGQRCNDNCGRVRSTARFSASLKSRCWPLCCNVDVTKMARK